MTDLAYKSLIVVLIGHFFAFNLLFFGLYLIVKWGSDRFPCVRIGVHKPLKTYETPRYFWTFKKLTFNIPRNNRFFDLLDFLCSK